MFEAKLLDGSILKRIVEAIKDVVNDVNIDVSPSGKSPLRKSTCSGDTPNLMASLRKQSQKVSQNRLLTTFFCV